MLLKLGICAQMVLGLSLILLSIKVWEKSLFWLIFIFLLILFLILSLLLVS